MTATTTKKKGLFLALPILALLFLISTAMTSGTFAKYTSTLAGQDTAIVAKWDIKATDKATDGGNSLGASDTHINLWEHAFTSKINNKNADNTHFIIAPGVSGSFLINVKNGSDVAANINYSITGKSTNPKVPLLFRADGATDWVTLSQLSAQIGTKEVAIGATLAQKVDWKWVFEGNTGYDASVDTNSDGTISRAEADKADTDLGIANGSYELDVAMTATQVAPVAP